MSVPQLHNLSHVTGDSVLNSSTKLEISSLYALYFNFVIPQTLGWTLPSALIRITLPSLT